MGPPKMSLQLEAKNLPALIIKPRLIIVAHTDDLGWNKSSKQWKQMLIPNLNRIVSTPNVMPGHILYCTTNCIPIDLMFKEPLLLTNKFGTAWAIKMTTDRHKWSELPMGAATATYTRSGTSVISRLSVTIRAWAGPTPTDRDQTQFWSQTLQHHDDLWL